jgi:uncharacterized delta-60 repeat protein
MISVSLVKFAMMRISLITIFALGVILSPSLLLAQPGSLDPTLGLVSTASQNGIVRSVAVQPDGKIIIGGNFNEINGLTRLNVARLNVDGSVDAGFTTSVAGLRVFTVSLQADNKILISGVFTSVNGISRNGIARLNSNGTVDMSFNPTGLPNNAVVQHHVIHSSGKLYVGARYEGGINRIFRLNSDGTLDQSFSTVNPETLNGGTLFKFAVQPDGKVIVAGLFSVNNNSTSIDGIIRINADGSRDLSFNGTNGPAAGLRNFGACAIQPDGKILFSRIAGGAGIQIFRLQPDGSVDTGFICPMTGGTIYSIIPQSDGKMVLAGLISTSNITSRGIVRINPDGSFDTAFNAASPDFNSFGALWDAKLTSDGKIVGGGGINNISQGLRVLIRVFNGATTDPVPPTPTLTSLSLTSTSVGTLPLSLTLTGSNFTAAGATVHWTSSTGTVVLTPSMISATQLTIQVPATLLSSAGTVSITVRNTATGTPSAALPFTINNPAPTLNSLSPTTAIAGSGSQTLTLTGTNFVPTSQVLVNGSTVATTFVSATQIRITLPAILTTIVRTLSIAVSTPAPGGGTTAPQVFTVTAAPEPPTPCSTVTTVAGSNSGYADGTGAAAQFASPRDVTTDGTSIFIADLGNYRIRKIDRTTGAVITLAGSSYGYTDGISTTAKFAAPSGIATDGINIFVADGLNECIRKITIATGEVTTLAGNGQNGYVDGIGKDARFSSPKCVATDGTSVFVTENSNCIRRITIATGEVTTFAGSRSGGYADGIGTAAQFSAPFGMTTDGTNIFVIDANNKRIRKIAIATGMVTTLSGSGAYGYVDGMGTTAQFTNPQGITTDGTKCICDR